jgi:hypothetical protein
MSRVSKCGPCEGDDIRPDCGPASNQMLVMQGDILVPVQRSKNDIRCQKRRECDKKRGAPSRNCVPQQNLRNMYEKYKKLFDCAYINLVDKRRCVAQKILARVRKEDKSFKKVEDLYNKDSVKGDLKTELPNKDEPRMKMYIAEHNLYNNGMQTMDESLKAHGVFQAYLDYIRSDICEDTKSEKALYREYFTAWRADLNDLRVVSKCSNTLSLLLDDFMFDIDFLVERCGHKEAMKYLCNWDENSFNDMKTLKANIMHSYHRLHTALVAKAADKTRVNNFCSEDTCKDDLNILDTGSTRMASPQPNRRGDGYALQWQRDVENRYCDIIRGINRDIAAQTNTSDRDNQIANLKEVVNYVREGRKRGESVVGYEAGYDDEAGSVASVAGYGGDDGGAVSGRIPATGSYRK